MALEMKMAQRQSLGEHQTEGHQKSGQALSPG